MKNSKALNIQLVYRICYNTMQAHAVRNGYLRESNKVTRLLLRLLLSQFECGVLYLYDDFSSYNIGCEICYDLRYSSI